MGQVAETFLSWVGIGFRGLGFRVWGLGLRVEGFGIWGLGFIFFEGFALRVSIICFAARFLHGTKVQGLEFWVQGRYRVLPPPGNNV